MLYSIIPPILVILSLAGIIIFLAKKAPQVAKLDDEDDLEREQRESMASVGFFRRLGFRMKNIEWANFGKVFLGIFEKATRGAKMLFARLENKSKVLNESIRTKRVGLRVKKDVSGRSEFENNEDADIMDKIEKYQPQKNDEYPKNENVEILEKEKDTDNDVEREKIIRPVVSSRAVKSKPRVEMKDRLENLLIERIAANPKDVEAYERLGEYYMEIDSMIDAKECFKQVLKLDPKNENVKYRMRRLEAMLHKR